MALEILAGGGFENLKGVPAKTIGNPAENPYQIKVLPENQSFALEEDILRTMPKPMGALTKSCSRAPKVQEAVLQSFFRVTICCDKFPRSSSYVIPPKNENHLQPNMCHFNNISFIKYGMICMNQ